MASIPLGLAALLLAAAPLRATPAQDGSDVAIDITPQQEAAVARGLAWLADAQRPDGSWVAKIGFKLNNSYQYTARDRGHVGVTALSCMAFMAGGHLPGRGEYGPVVDRGLEFVLSCVQDDGYITYAGTRMYSHAFATLFLAEIYGMTHREDVQVKLQKAVDFIVKSQNEEGGWRYVPLARESDMSIVVCQVLALRAARNIGIRVPKSTIDRAAIYVVESAVTENDPRGRSYRVLRNDVGTFRYQKDTFSRSSVPLTAAGVTALHGLGIYSNELIRKGIDYLNTESPPLQRPVRPRRALLLLVRSLLRRASDVHPGGTGLAQLLHEPASHPARHAARGRLLAERRRARTGLRHRDRRLDPRNSVQLAAHLPALRNSRRTRRPLRA